MSETRLQYWLRTGETKPYDHDALVEKYGTSKAGHAIFAPSASAMWLRCAGSLLPNVNAGDDAGEAAAYGTVAHHVADRWLKMGSKPVKLLGRTEGATAGGTYYEFVIDTEMMEMVEEYIDWCNEVPGDQFYEQRVDLSPIMPIPKQGGTADHFACEPGLLTITDLKTGTGVRVFAEENSQAMLYALGVFFEWDWIYRFERIVIRICQPRLDVFETWECNRATLLVFAEQAEAAALKAWNEHASRSPSGKACRWCRVSTPCPARLKELEELIDDTFDGLDEEDRTPVELTETGADLVELDVMAFGSLQKRANSIAKIPYKELDTSVLSYTLTYRKQIESWFADIAAELLRRAENGEKIPHHSLKDGRNKYFWKSPDKDMTAAQIAKRFGLDEDQDVWAPRKLRTPNDMKKWIRAQTKKKPKEIAVAIDDLIGHMAGKRTLAPLTDDRPDVSDLADESFDAEDAEDDL